MRLLRRFSFVLPTNDVFSLYFSVLSSNLPGYKCMGLLRPDFSRSRNDGGEIKLFAMTKIKSPRSIPGAYDSS